MSTAMSRGSRLLSGRISVVPAAGVEPATFALSGRCTAICALPAYIGREKGLEPSFSWENQERPTRSSPARAILEVYYFSGQAVSNDPRPFSGTPLGVPRNGAFLARTHAFYIYIYNYYYLSLV